MSGRICHSCKNQHNVISFGKDGKYDPRLNNFTEYWKGTGTNGFGKNFDFFFCSACMYFEFIFDENIPFSSETTTVTGKYRCSRRGKEYTLHKIKN